jgi:prepilin-type processing-associated H-X9-DG protein
MNCTNDGEAFSFHPGGVNLLFADGSVRLMAEQVTPQTYTAMITRTNQDMIQ